MLKLSHAGLTVISGFVWLAVGFFLMSLGLGLLIGKFFVGEPQPMIAWLSPLLGGSEQAAIGLIAVALYVGFLKGKHVLGKSARKGVERIKTLSNPANLTMIYSAKYYILLGSMILIGISIKYLGIPTDVRGFVDVTIGSALINGAVIYFRLAQGLRASASSV